MSIKTSHLNLELSKLIGQGAFAKVYLAKDLSNNKKYAVKILETSKMCQKKLELFKTEKKILRLAIKQNFRNIIKLQDVLKGASGIYYIILEYCNGNSLDRILYDYYKINKKPFPENYVRYLMKEILLGVKSLHDHGIIHRDLKLDNILLNFKSEINRIKLNLLSAEVRITDFNASYISNKVLPKTFIGTVPNMAPTIVENGINNEEKPYDEKIDIWSLGTICYEMLYAKPLFRIEKKEKMFQKIVSSKITLEKTISPQARNFLKYMLQRDGKNRLSVSELLNHEFIKGNNDEFNSKNCRNNNLLINNNFPINNAFNKSSSVLNIIFKSYRTSINIITTENTKIKDLVRFYFFRINRPDLMDNFSQKVGFIYNSQRLKINEYSQETIKQMNLTNNITIEVIFYHLQ